jgi:exodeoxyribonuclease VII small subunit
MKIKDMNYEEGYARIQELLEELEGGELKLQESVERFKEAMDIYEHLRVLLTKAEGEVKQVLERDGSLQEEDFPGQSQEGIDESY